MIPQKEHKNNVDNNLSTNVDAGNNTEIDVVGISTDHSDSITTSNSADEYLEQKLQCNSFNKSLNNNENKDDDTYPLGI